MSVIIGHGVPKKQGFCSKKTVVKWNCCILWIDIEWGLQKLGIILENKVPPNLKLAKHDFSKSC